MISSPPVIINQYLIEKLQEKLPNRFSNAPLFLPTSPENINAISSSDAREVFAIYDRMFRLRRDPFPHIKKEQLLYYFYKVNDDPEALFETIQVVHDLMDRGDESAQDINAWIHSKASSSGVLQFGTGSGARQFKPVYFHEMKVFQLEEARDIEGFDSNTTFFASKIIINYDYHVQSYS